VLGALLDLAPAERDLLLETVRAWIDNAGSTAGAARRLFCHRNTVLGRIRRVERLTGRRLDHPGEAVELILAIEADRIQRGGRVNETDPAAPGR
jgi:DNA-binding PucR family transcriptional regulator